MVRFKSKVKVGKIVTDGITLNIPITFTEYTDEEYQALVDINKDKERAYLNW